MPARKPLLCKPRCLPRGGGEAAVAAPARAAAQDHRTLTVPAQIMAERAAGLLDHRSRRNLKHQRLAGRAVALGAAAMTAAGRPVLAPAPEGREVAQVLV